MSISNESQKQEARKGWNALSPTRYQGRSHRLAAASRSTFLFLIRHYV